MRTFLMSNRIAREAFFIAFLALRVFVSEGADVSFYTIHKAQKFNQDTAGAPTLGGGNPYRFGALVAPAAAGTVLSATVSGSSGAPQQLAIDPAFGWFSFTAKFSTQAGLDA